MVAVGPAPAVEAGGHFGLYISNIGFGVTLGFGDWGVYTSAWSDPSWSMRFSSTLHGYGEWVFVPGLGRVWRPWVEVGWQPYTHGRWVMTAYGWTWVAYEPWGYLPHHYGSWAHCSSGWVWVPGYTYSPANVVWVQTGGYVGWYARPPHGWSHAARGYRRGYQHGYGDGYRDGWRDARYATYVDWHHLASDNVSHYAVGHATATRTRGATVAAAPSAGELRRRGGVSVPRHEVARRTVTVDDRHVELVRPEGVTHSIERHAAPTVRQTLAPAALERRQPGVELRSQRQRGGSERSVDHSGGHPEAGSTRSMFPSRTSSDRWSSTDAAVHDARPVSVDTRRSSSSTVTSTRRGFESRATTDVATPRPAISSGGRSSPRSDATASPRSRSEVRHPQRELALSREHVENAPDARSERAAPSVSERSSSASTPGAAASPRKPEREESTASARRSRPETRDRQPAKKSSPRRR
jgi:hypothetical protein